MIDSNLYNKFYQIIESIHDTSDFNVLLDTTINNLVDFINAKGGILCLYYDPNYINHWKHVIVNNISTDENCFNNILGIVKKTYEENKIQVLNQNGLFSDYNYIVSFPLNIRNICKGVVCLFINDYLSDQLFHIVSALCNQIMINIENVLIFNIQKKYDVLKKELDAQRNYAYIIGTSEKIQKINNTIERIKDTPTTVLIEGPIGTEKELIARKIHFNSNRKNNKFVSQYCGDIQASILEGELFGYDENSFFGIKQGKQSLFEIAEGGTLFLNEITNIKPTTQVKLLKFIQDRIIVKENNKKEKVNIRIICSTTRSLKEEMQNNKFLPDLFYRLNVVKIDIPSLKERISDIPLLSIHFLEKHTKKIGKKIIGITDEVMKYLENYYWPGNVVQLENEIERIVTLVDNSTLINTTDLLKEILNYNYEPENFTLNNNNSLKDAVENLEKQMIINVLDETGWNQTQAAKKLGLSRQGLIKKIQRYKLEK